MAIPQTRHFWTYDDYMQMPDDGRRYEVLDGELVEMPSPNRRHQQIIGRIFRILSEYVESSALGEVYVAPFDVKLSPIDVVQPDVLFIAVDHLGLLDTTLNVQGAPDLCVEILSPGTRTRDLRQKRDRYARFGVREYWLVDPEAESIAVLVLHEGTYTPMVEAAGATPVSSAVLRGLSVAAQAFFR